MGPLTVTPPPAQVEREFRRYLDCGIFAHGFAWVTCAWRIDSYAAIGVWNRFAM
jgi:hypothetical protein